MARTEGEIVIGRPVDMVSDYVADQSNEPTMQSQATGMSATTRRTSRWPSRERSSRPTSPLLSGRRGTSICSASASAAKTWRRRDSGSAGTRVYSAGTAPAAHRTWISRSREAPQRRSGRSQS
jgi:hypothetical protein